MDDQELERLVRRGLERHAEHVDVDPPMAGRVAGAIARRRRRRWTTALAAAAAVVLVAGGVALADRSVGPAPAPPVATTSSDPPAPAPGWRTEQWGELAVDVPAEWGYGGAPMSDGSACSPVAMRSADGTRLPGESDPDLGWVGRPILMTDVCAGYPWIEHSPQEEPRAPYVWLGAAVEPGVVAYANGYVQETIEVEGVMLTVASDDAALRERIVGSARAGERCESSYDASPPGHADTATDDRGEPVSAEVCAYRYRDGDFTLTSAAPLAADRAAAAFRAQERAPAAPVEGACQDALSEFVLVRAWYQDLTGAGEPERQVVYRMTCGGEVDLGEDDAGARLRTDMVPAGVAPWAVGGIPAVVLGPTGPDSARWVHRYFIGMQG